MGFRTSEGQVKDLLGRNWDRKTILIPFIRQANILVNQLALLSAKYCKPVLDPASAVQVEALLAAHKYMLHDPGYQQKTTDGASGTLQTQKGNGLERTDYGKEALLMDFTGVLEALDKRKVASGFWAGTKHNPYDFWTTDLGRSDLVE